MQQLSNGLTAARIDVLVRKWLARLPHPISSTDRDAGLLYQVSILQAEFSLTQLLDRPLHGRAFFEEVIRENLDLGRPDQVQLIFGRRVNKRTPSRYRTRVITQGVVPSLHATTSTRASSSITRKGARCAPRPSSTTATTSTSADGWTTSNSSKSWVSPPIDACCACNVSAITVNSEPRSLMISKQPRVAPEGGQRCPALRFGCARVQAFLCALLAFRLLPRGFDNRQLRAQMAPLLGVSAQHWSPGRMTYDLRRLRLHGLIERIPRSRRYRVTAAGIRTALCTSAPMHASCVLRWRRCSIPIHSATAASSAPSRCSTARSLASGRAMISPHNLTHL